jgi:hypothetical protein
MQTESQFEFETSDYKLIKLLLPYLKYYNFFFKDTFQNILLYFIFKLQMHRDR